MNNLAGWIGKRLQLSKSPVHSAIGKLDKHGTLWRREKKLEGLVIFHEVVITPLDVLLCDSILAIFVNNVAL